MPYLVRVPDMYQFMDETEAYDLAAFDSLEAAEQAAKAMVERGLRHSSTASG